MKVYINPPSNIQAQHPGGIDRVVDAQHEYLGEFGVDIAHNPESADVIANHATLLTERPNVPMVSHCHGMYWSDYEWPNWTDLANKEVIEAMRRADAVTAPSQWVADAISRGMLVAPHVIYHGIDIDLWQPGESSEFIFWNKAREDSVSTTKYMQHLASLMTKANFVSTFGIPTSNVKVTGPIDYRQMQSILPKSDLYLQTTRETFGVSTIEALACGVPVVGWDYAGQREIVVQGETGILVPYGDYSALIEAIHWCSYNRERLSANARQDAIDRWQWRDKVAQYANLYKSLYTKSKVERPKISIVVTTYNLAHYLSDCLQSILEQSIADWDVVVVDDCSQDNPKSIIDGINDPRIQYIRTRENVGLSTARNVGWRRTTGKYVLFLDADDMIDVAALELLSDALDKDTGIHIAYGGLDIVSEDGSGRRKNDWPSGSFDWRAQISHLNQLPYCSMMRREVLERSGGYRERDWRAEDASLWTRVTSFGFRAAMVTDRATLIYRLRSNSKSVQERSEHADGDGDWTRWFPWRTGASSGKEGEDIFYKGLRPNHKIVPFGAQGSPANRKHSWPVHHHAHPTVSIIIPVAPSHRRYLVDALDSCIAQTVISWEAIVVDDSTHGKGSMPSTIQSHPFAKVYYSNGAGTGTARNIGINAAEGDFVLFLDADDVLDPKAIEEMLRAYVNAEGGYVYCDCKLLDDPKRLDGPGDIVESLDYDQETFIRSGYTQDMPGCHSVTILVAKADLETIRFDESMAYWEDWKLPLELAVAGIRGIRVPRPLLTYRLNTGIRRKASEVHEGAIREALRKQFEPYTTGEKEMCACTGGNGGRSARNAAIQALSQSEQPTPVVQTVDLDNINGYVSSTNTVRLRYIGERTAGVPYRGRVSRKQYVFGRDPSVEFVDVDPRDVLELMRTGDFQVIDTSVIVERSAVWN